MTRTTVIIADDHTIVREGLHALLSQEKDLHVIGEAEDGRAAVNMAEELKPSIIVMDIAMPLLNGLEATRQILKSSPLTKILILSAHSDDAYVEKALSLGASGFLVKQTAFHVLPETIRRIVAGSMFLSPAISKRLGDHWRSSLERGDVPVNHFISHLTSREMEVLQLVAEGKANKQIADELKISIKTVEKHRQTLMEKLSIHDTAGLTRYAISAGIIESSTQSTTQ
jgi:DNA-binding NarL/FixJ family response regulator